MAKDPSVQSIIVNRPVVDTSEFAGQGAQAYSRVAGGFASFFGQRLKESRAEEVEKTEAINEAMLQRMELVVQSDLGAAREASRTGDFSKFVNVEQAKQKFFQVNVPKIIGRSLAINAREEIQTRLNDLPASENATEFLAKDLAERTKDMDPFSAAEYLRTTDKYVPQMMKSREKTMANAASLASKEKIPVFVRHGLSSGTLTNLKQYNQSIARHAAADPGNYVEQTQQYQAMYDRELARVATEADNPASIRAMEMIQTKDPDRDGTSVVDRLGADFDNIVNENIKKATRITSAKASEILARADVRITKLATGGGGTDSFAKVTEDLVREFSDVGSLSNPKFLAMWTKARKEMGKYAVTNTALKEFKATGTVTGDKKTQEQVYKKLKADGDQEGAMEFLQSAGAPTSVRQDWKGRLLSGNIGSVTAAVTEIKAAHIKLPLESYIDDGPAMAVYMAASSAGGPEEAAERIQKIQQNLSQSGEKFRGHFARRFNIGQPSAGDRTAATGGTRSVRDIIKGWVNDLDDDQKASLGLPEGTEADQLSTTVFNRLAGLLDAASVSTADLPITDEKAVLNELLKFGRGEFETLPDSEGNPKIYVRSTPKYVIDAAGKKVVSKPYDNTTVDGWEEHKENAHIVGTQFESAGLRPDDRTRVDGTAAVTVPDMAGFDQDFAIPITRPDRPTVIDAELVRPGGILENAFEVVEIDQENGTAKIMVTPPGADELDIDDIPGGSSIPLDDRLSLVYDPNSTTWRMRYVDRGKDDERNFMRKATDLFGLTGNRDDAMATLQDLTDTQRGAVMREKARLDPRTWTDEELRRRAMGNNPLAAKEIARRRAGGKRIELEGVTEVRPGTATNAEAAPQTITSEDEASEVGNLVDDMFGQGLARGHYTEEGVKRAKQTISDPTEQVLEANLQSMANGHFFDSLDTPDGEQFMSRFAKFIEHSEGFEGFVYDDEGGAQAKKWTMGSKGNPTIGLGFNLRRPDADALLRQAGAPSMTRLIKGEASITHPQAVKLMELANQQNIQFLRKHFDGVMMEKHRWMALLSLMYNSRWKDGKPTLIGPKLTKAIREGRWEDAAYEIEFNSSGGVSKVNQKGINARRRREAAMWRGAEL